MAKKTAGPRLLPHCTRLKRDASHLQARGQTDAHYQVTFTSIQFICGYLDILENINVLFAKGFRWKLPTLHIRCSCHKPDITHKRIEFFLWIASIFYSFVFWRIFVGKIFFNEFRICLLVHIFLPFVLPRLTDHCTSINFHKSVDCKRLGISIWRKSLLVHSWFFISMNSHTLWLCSQVNQVHCSGWVGVADDDSKSDSNELTFQTFLRPNRYRCPLFFRSLTEIIFKRPKETSPFG